MIMKSKNAVSRKTKLTNKNKELEQAFSKIAKPSRKTKTLKPVSQKQLSKYLKNKSSKLRTNRARQAIGDVAKSFTRSRRLDVGSTINKNSAQITKIVLNRLASRNWKYDKNTNQFSMTGRSPFNKSTLRRFESEINAATKLFHQMMAQQIMGEEVENINTKQMDVLLHIYSHDMDLQEFASKYPDAYERIFDEDYYDI